MMRDHFTCLGDFVCRCSLVIICYYRKLRWGCEKTAGGLVTLRIRLSWTSLVGASLKLRRPETRSLHQKRTVMIEVGRVEIREGDEAVEIVEAHPALLENLWGGARLPLEPDRVYRRAKSSEGKL